MHKPLIWTIGHSTRSLEEFLKMLKSFEIETVADIRAFLGSRKYPHFNKEALADALKREGIDYIHMPELGGRRRPRPDSSHTEWRNAAFRAYADYMDTPEFEKAAARLQELARKNRLAYMCSEAVWWRCHRSLVSDYLKLAGWNVQHIMSEGKSSEHPFTAPVREALQQ